MSLEITSGLWQIIVVAHVGATWMLVGLIWTIQVVHYPSFAGLDRTRFVDFQHEHMAKMGSIVGPPWLVEGLSVLAVFLFAPTTTVRVLGIVGGALEAIVIATTLWASIPAHDVLAQGFDEAAHRKLVKTNWIRTGAWTARGVIALAVVALTVSA